MITVDVPLGDRSYPVHVGDGALGMLGELIPSAARRVAVVTQQGIPVAVEPALEHRVFAIGPGEQAKTLATVEELCSGFSGFGLTREDVVVAVGGGVVTDTGGFAAASYHRGVALVNVPTTLLGQIDAAIGGKTGVNLPEGKNLVGAFWQPRGVICDTETLATLPPREMRSGLGEMAKYHFLGGGDLDDLDLVARVARCVEIKAEVVAADETESGRRACLNYGHTLAHALESVGGYELMHGEAVGVGLAFAAHLARSLGRIDDSRVAYHHEVLNRYELPDRIPEGMDPEELVAAMGRDKKATDGLVFALDGPGGVEVVHGVSRSDVITALKEVV